MAPTYLRTSIMYTVEYPVRVFLVLSSHFPYTTAVFLFPLTEIIVDSVKSSCDFNGNSTLILNFHSFSDSSKKQ